MNVTGAAGYAAQQIGTGTTAPAQVQSSASATEKKTAETPAVEQDTVVLSEEALRLNTLGGGTDWPDPPSND